MTGRSVSPKAADDTERAAQDRAVGVSSGNGPVLRVAGLVKSYRLGKLRVPALRGLDLEVGGGEFVAIVGPSGSGKTTLLNLAGLLDRADAGEVWLGFQATSSLSEAQRARLRGERIGFIFQTFNLLPHLTAEENVALPLRYADASRVRFAPREALARVGLAERTRHRPDELSGGEQQRVAIARALVLDPPLILADEPTGDLDSETARQILELLEELRAEGKTLLVVTHNEELAAAASRKIHMRDGHIVDDGVKPRAKKATESAGAKRRQATVKTKVAGAKPGAGTRKAEPPADV
jgi:putative ABC transport system ATP-binding protein